VLITTSNTAVLHLDLALTTTFDVPRQTQAGQPLDTPKASACPRSHSGTQAARVPALNLIGVTSTIPEQRGLPRYRTLPSALTCRSGCCRFTLVDEPCACRKPHPCRLSDIAILMDDSAETVLSTYGEAFDLGWLKRLGPGSQGSCGC
jgi:hypothetical protein